MTIRLISTVLLFVFAVNNNIDAAARKLPPWIQLFEAGVHKEMPYRLLKPLEYDAQKKYPLIVSLHGAGGKGVDNRKQMRDWNKQLADKKTQQNFPCYVLAPQSKELWNKKHLDNIKDIIKKLPSVDMQRIYILGHSMGGHGSFIMIQLDAKYFAAAAPSAGTGLKRTADFINAAVIKDIPIWTFHGDKDGTCPYAKVEKLFEQMKEVGGNMKLTSWKGDRHAVSAKFIPGAENGTTQFSSKRCDQETDFLTWLFKQKRQP